MKRFLALLFCSFSALAANYAPPPVVPDYSSLTNRAGSLINPAAIVLGATNALDGNGGVFLYAVSTQTVDNLTVLPSTSTSRWLRTSYIFSTTPATSPLSLSNGTLSISALTNWFTFSAGTNMQVTVTSNTVSYAMTNTTFSGSGGSAISFNGTAVTNVNITNSHAVRWTGVDTNYQAYITNYFYWEGIPVQFPTLRDDPYITWGQSGSNLTATIPAEALDPTRWEHLNWPTLMGRYSASIGDIEYITVGANLNLDSASGVLSAVIPPGTNSWQIGVDGTLVVTPNLADSSELDPTATGTNITYAIVSESIATNKINTTFQHLLLNQYRINNLTNWFLSITNNAADTGRVVWYTNSLGDYVAYATNLPAGGGSGAGTNAFVNGVLYQPFRLTNNLTDTGRVLWRTNSDGDILAYATNFPASGSGLGTNAFVNGVLLQPVYFTNSSEVFWSTNGNGHVVLSINSWDGFWSDLTNSLVASNNIAFAYDTSNNKLMISAVVSTNSGTAVTVDGGADLSRANFADASTTGLFDISGTNITIRLPDRDFGSVTVSDSGATITLDDSTVTSNKIVAANVTIDKLSATGTPTSTNFLAGDYSWKQVTTNMIPGLVADILSAATNGPTGGGTSVFVNGASISNPNFTNSSTVLFSVSDSTNITATVTNVAGSTTSNVVQRIGSAIFYLSGDPSIMSNESYSGVITNLLLVTGTGTTATEVTVSLGGVSNTNYLVSVEIEDGNDPDTVAVWDIKGDKAASGFTLASSLHDNVASPNGYWFRIWVMDTVTVGGSGGDVISTANNTFTGTNTFNGTLEFGGGFATTNIFAPHRQKVILHENEYSLGQSISTGDIGLPSIVAAAISSGTLSASQTSANNHQGLLRISSASGANSGVYGLSGVGTIFSQVGLTWESITRPLNTNAGVRVYLGFMDSTSAGAATDGIHLFRSNNIIIPQVYYNGSLTQGSEYTISSNQFLRTKIVVTASNAARFVVVDSDTGTSILDETITTTLPDSTSRLFGLGWKGFYTNAAAAAIEDFDWTTAYYDRPISR